MTGAPTLETPRLRLRDYRLDDFDAYAAMWADPAVVRFIGGVTFSRDVSWTRFLRHAGMWRYTGFGYFALEDRATGRFVGECGFQEARRQITPSLEGTLEAGWSLVPDAHGQGLATEAMQAALAWAVSAHAGRRITCMIDEDHIASRRVAAKLGFAQFAAAPFGGKTSLLFEHATPHPA